MSKNTICLWYDKDAEAAARFYAPTFPDSAVGAVHHAPSDYPGGKVGDVLAVEFTVLGIRCQSAPFKRNDQILDALPVGVIVFPGSGISANLADKARKMGIPVWRFTDEPAPAKAGYGAA
jgi:hypothetical protein